MSKKPSASFVDHVISLKGIAVLLLVITLLSFGMYVSFRKSASITQPARSPRAIPHGKWGFTVDQSDKTVPQFSRGFIDPYDPAKGEAQTVTIAVAHTQPVTKVTAVLKTDNKISQPVAFTLVSGTDTNGQWQGSWQMTDAYLYTYNLVLQAESNGSKPATVEVTLR